MSHRSLCTLVCKWTYCLPDGWDPSFWIGIGLEDLVENNFSKLGNGAYQADRTATEAPHLEIKPCIFQAA